MAEKAVGIATEAIQFVEDVKQRGLVTVIGEKIMEQLSNAWDLVLDALKSWVMDQIIKKVTAKLLSMLDPTGIMAVVNSCIALYKAIQSFIKYLRRMLEIVNSFVEGILEIAQGAIAKSYTVETSLQQLNSKDFFCLEIMSAVMLSVYI